MTTRLQLPGMIRRFAVVLVLAPMAARPDGGRAQTRPAQGDPETAHTFESGGRQHVAYTRMSRGEFEVHTQGKQKKGGKTRHCFLRTVRPDALRHYRNSSLKFDSSGKEVRPLPLPDEVVGAPGLFCRWVKRGGARLHFTINEPARCFMYLKPVGGEIPSEWQAVPEYRAESWQLYRRDFFAGRHTLAFHEVRVIGAGLVSLAGTVYADGDEATAELVRRRRSGDVKLYERMTHDGLTVEALPTRGMRGKVLLQIVRPRGVLDMDHKNPISSQFEVPDELIGLPALVPRVRIATSYRLRFRLSKPARVYAYIEFYRRPGQQPERHLWSAYRRSPYDSMTLYYRDFPAGEQEINLGPCRFTGMGVHGLDRLSDRERLLGHAVVEHDKPEAALRNDFDESKDVTLSFRWVNPGNGNEAGTGKMTVALEAHADKLLSIPAGGLVEGILYYAEVTVSCDEVSREFLLPHGSFPPPKPDAAVKEPFFPYGGYMRLQVNRDRGLYRQALRSTFYQLRQLQMNTIVMSPRDMRTWYLDLAQQYGLRCVLRLGKKTGLVADVPDKVVHHPAVLTYMVGDEPRVSEMDTYRDMFRALRERYPEYAPISATMLDGWGTGNNGDPVRIFSEYLQEFDPIIYGRFYVFRKDNYGPLHPIAYKHSAGAKSICRQIDGFAPGAWWLAPQFFGHNNPRPYWRIPTAAEIKSLLHLAMANRCTGFLGWVLHSHKAERKTTLRRRPVPYNPTSYQPHYRIESIGFDGVSTAPARFNALEGLSDVGAFIAQVKTVLLQMTKRRFNLSRIDPVQVEATAHWLADGRLAVYLVNLDPDRPHDGRVWLHAGNTHWKDTEFQEAAQSAVDVRTGEEMSLQSDAEATFDRGRGNLYLRLAVPQIEPGGGRLIVISGDRENGAFPESVRPGKLERIEQAIELGRD